MKDQIENIESHIDELDDHLNNGVEIKTINWKEDTWTL
jgi:hypothetical protein